MPYLIGIDEAGYGPNLGPLVQSAAVAWSPDDECLWARLSQAVCRAKDRPAGRLVVDDSKLVYTARKGIEKLEHVALGIQSSPKPTSVRALFEQCGVGSTATDLVNEPWYLADQSLPVFSDEADCEAAGIRLHRSGLEQEVRWFPTCVMVTPTPRFNSLLTQFDSKGAILTRGVAALMQSALARIPADDIVIIAVDKQGGRNRYAAMLQSAFPEAWVSVELESAAESRYRLEGLKRKVTVVFRPRAEAEHMSVAVASMFSKYIRELMMDQFNRFWTAKLPGLAPTAGYPVDAKRFMAAIQPVLKTLEIDESTVWRRK